MELRHKKGQTANTVSGACLQTDYIQWSTYTRVDANLSLLHVHT